MPSSHPPTLLTLAKRALHDEVALPARACILVATSGGPDSVALLDVLARLAKVMHFEVAAHGVDHGLRSNAGAELDLAEAHCSSLGVAFTRSHVGLRPGSNVQARAREARYAALEVARKRVKATFIATAHHADDRAETVLMRILRGAGLGGLAVLPPRDGRLIRPLIRARRRDVELHLERHRIPFATDPSNKDPRYLRTRVRGEVLPLLAALDPSVTAHLCALADDHAQFRDASFKGANAYPIPRAARLALARLARSQTTTAMTVLLPHGLEVRKAAQRSAKTTTRASKKR